ncbi:SGNH/GDSL hydrolase family protein [Blastopirellula sp. JC732]|uniref:SGNH/GDSL hydrolase family protein n=1 Tax=Blastopirellula sediminis TaxID=2894196 RepID=A0A9X1MM68_9BACT|nr:SGNH/GDSL hydrolase family protein [Blastopirellula sediminis]MCC9607331.1 SGNH/GDSL hydrolase family protein [Blastopirellula sediminis]MCC9629376.1 SGNH/GDSL hydrolase family protein [Blastopirellula sediminis]
MTSSRPFAWAMAWAVVTLFAANSALAELPESWKDGLVDGERVVFLGNTFIEREQRDGYIETALTAAYPDRNITFRNLGWSGDNVYGRSRARFGNVDEGWNHLNASLDLTKPTAVIICYGSNAAFAGDAGLDDFRTGYARLLDAVSKHTKKIMLLAPPPLEDLGRPLPDPTKHNTDLAKYTAAIRDLAYERQFAFVDLFAGLGEKFEPGVKGKATLTSNGVHLTEYGYWEAARVITKALGKPTPVVTLDKPTLTTAVPLNAAVSLPTHSVSYDDEVQDVAPDMIVRSTAPLEGTLDLIVDEQKLGTAAAAQWKTGIGVNVPKLADAAEMLRREIVGKNELFFHRYRPQNETYLFLFRKHEQGNNAVEIPQFDPLIAVKEETIAKLRQPLELTITLAPAQ